MKIGKIEVSKILEVLKPLSELVNETKFLFKKTGLHIIEYDPANVSLIRAEIKKESFLEYNITDEEMIGINATMLLSMVKDKKKDIVELEIKENHLLLKFNSGLTSKIPLIDIESDEKKIQKKIPDLPDVKHRITVKSKVMKEHIKHLQSNFDSVIFKVEDKKFILSSESDINTSEIEVKEAKVKAVTKDNTSKSKFAMEYITILFKHPISDDVVISIGNDFPLCVLHKTESTEIEFVLAPRVETD